MKIMYDDQAFLFRECDVKGMEKEEVEEIASKTGHMQYEPRAAWLVVPGIGYGLREDYCYA